MARASTRPRPDTVRFASVEPLEVRGGGGGGGGGGRSLAAADPW
jgi:hypothetical protein